MKNNINLIAIHGKAGAGKDTVGKIIQVLVAKNKDMLSLTKTKNFLLDTNSQIEDRYLRSDWEIKKFATPIKQIANILTGIPVERMKTQEDKEVVLGKEWNYNEIMGDFMSMDIKVIRQTITLRQLLQNIGDVMLQIHPDWLLNIMFRDYIEEPINVLKGEGYHLEDRFPSWIITDLRKSNEYNKIKELGGKCVKVIKFDKPDCKACDMENVKQVDCYSCINYPEIAENEPSSDKPGVGNTSFKTTLEADWQNHISETGLDLFTEWDYVIEAEHGNIDSLIKQTKEMLIKFGIL